MSENICVFPSQPPSSSSIFKVGMRKQRPRRIVPVFLPFSGCPMHCVYCAQDRQTGCGSMPVDILIQRTEKELESLPACSPDESRELAFYGGTFTALPAEDRRLCLAMLDRLRASGHVTHARCSTRPDALSPAVLDELKAHGVGLIELGIQSFSDTALSASCRGYDGMTALAACHTVKDAGFELGIQLLPGMPGSSEQVFINDARQALALHPACLRFYPCLVPEGTVLARWLHEGRYIPWSIEKTVAVLGQALALAWKKDVPVIRLSVAPEASFDASVLAGPRHPALGALIQAEALLITVQEEASRMEQRPHALLLPRACQGYLYGERGSLKKRWQALGLPPESIFFTDEEHAELRT